MTRVEDIAPWLGGALVLGLVLVLLSRQRILLVRWCFWAVAVPLVTAAFWVGEPAIAAVAGIVGVVAALEYGGLLGLGHFDRLLLAAGVVAVVLTTWLAPGEVFRVLGICALVLALAPLLAGDAEHGLRRLGAGLLGLIWLGPLAGLVPLGATGLALFVAVSVGDIAAYVAGRRLGGPFLSSLSPAKRWSGTVAGSSAAVGVLALLSALDWRTGVAVAAGAPIGDLLESMVKRGVRIKDSGGWMAGQGGLLDRIDSLLMTLAAVLLLGSG